MEIRSRFPEVHDRPDTSPVQEHRGDAVVIDRNHVLKAILNGVFAVQRKSETVPSVDPVSNPKNEIGSFLSQHEVARPDAL
jgi:hypothetical protein